jgi:hypothetical protein
VQDIFFADTGEPTDYGRAVAVLNAYFVPQVNTVFARQTFYQLTQKTAEKFSNLLLVLDKQLKTVSLLEIRTIRLEMLY